METLEKTTVYLPADIRRELAEVARRRRMSQAEVIREALQIYLAEQERPTLRSLGAANSDEITGRTVRAWLRDNWHRQ